MDHFTGSLGFLYCFGADALTHVRVGSVCGEGGCLAAAAPAGKFLEPGASFFTAVQ